MLDFQHWPETSAALDRWSKISPWPVEVGATPFEVIETMGSMSLRFYSPPATGVSRDPVFIVPSFINRPFILDLMPDKSLIGSFLDRGHHVYLFDWGVPHRHESNLRFDEIVSLYLDLALKKVSAHSGAERVHLVGHCLGGTVATVMASLNQDCFHSLTLLTTPVEFSGDQKLGNWVRNPNFDVDAFYEAYGNAPWPMLQSLFVSLKPMQMQHKYRHLLKKLGDKKFVRNFLAMELWSNDNIDMRGDSFRFVIQDLYKANKLAKGELSIGQKKIELHRLHLPILVVSASQDHIVPDEALLKASDVPHSRQFLHVVAEGGHVAAILSAKAKSGLWPRIGEWIVASEQD
jgi:polyhydroxyalkanoate synthase